jgi:NCS1 family nucleobase:cation symporter-1
MVPWKIIHSAASLLSFMAGLGIFLAPIAAIIGSDYWLVKKTHINVPQLYKSRGMYRYNEAGINWRAAVAFLISVVPNLPGMAHSVNPKINPGGAVYIYNMFYIYGFTSAFVSYWLLSKFFPAPETLIPETITGDDYLADPNEEAHSEGAVSVHSDEKKAVKSTEYPV